jgi:flagellar basal-body rod modification protein FlgD
MKAALQQKIAPSSPLPRKQELNQLAVSDSSTDPVVGQSNDVDFKSLLLNSNRAEQSKRAAIKSGDLSSAKTYDDFLEQLNRQTDQERVPKNTLDKDDFLTLFVTQLQHQDPLNPKDGAEMASQLAEFNGLEQMINVNKALERLESAEKTSQSFSYINYIGKEVTVGGGKVYLGDKIEGEVSFKPKSPTNSTTLEVRNTNGAVVATRELGPFEEGDHQLVWDGMDQNGEKLPQGIYSLSIIAKNMKEEDIPVDVSTRVNITGLNLGAEDPNFYTSLGEMHYEDLTAIGEKGFAKTNTTPQVGNDLPQGLPDLASEATNVPPPEKISSQSSPEQGQKIDSNDVREQLLRDHLQQTPQ